MKYDIYFHGGCFDGVASAAMLKYFLNLRGDDFSKYIPLTHPVDKDKWRKMNPPKPFAITDILYHPKASIWFDHHPTTFIDKNWEKGFKGDGSHVLDTGSDSCTGLIFRHFMKRAKVRPPKYIADLAKWADIIDHDLLKVYKTPKDAVNLISGAVGIAKSFVDKKPSASYAKFLINSLAREPFKKTVLRWPVKKRIDLHRKGLKMSFPKIEENLVLRGGTVILYGMSKNLAGARFASYYFYPKVKYGIRLIKRGKLYVSSVGVNPWSKPRSPAHIGKYLAEKYGGGGHSYAASASFKTKKEALDQVLNIADYLNKHL